MKTMHLKIRIILAFLLFVGASNVFANKADAVLSKKISKSYPVTSSDYLLEIKNKFGDVSITTWDKKEIQIEITISIESSNEKKAQERLDAIDVDINKSSEKLSLITTFEKSNNIKLNGKNAISVDYVVKMPKSNSLEMKNSFGAFAINDLDGKADIMVEYGSAQVGKMMHPESNLEFKFSKPVRIDHIDNGSLSLKYSTVTLGTSNDLKIRSEFTDTEIQSIEKLDLVLKFGSIKIDQVGEIKVSSNMSAIEIGSLKSIGLFKPQYGSLSINELKNSFNSLEVDGEFSPIDIQVEKGGSFALDLSTSMASINVPEMKWEEHNKDHNKEQYKGRVGLESDNLLKVKSSFGAIDISY